MQAGLTVTADCADCHTAHHELPASDPRSSVNRANIARTCAQCHRGIFELFTASVHSTDVTHTAKELPVCADCHSAHSIKRTDLSDFRLHIMDQCGRCHRPDPRRDRHGSPPPSGLAVITTGSLAPGVPSRRDLQPWRTGFAGRVTSYLVPASKSAGRRSRDGSPEGLGGMFWLRRLA